MWELIYFYIFIFSFLVASVLIATLAKIAINFGILDRPDSKRKIHRQSKPLLGGIGMYGAFTFTIMINVALIFVLEKFNMLPLALKPHISGILARAPQIIAVLLTSLILVFIGLVDDIKGLSAKTKLFLQFILALIVFLSGIRITLFINNIFVSGFLTIFWIIGITNAFNLLDNMDGLSCGIAFISSLIFFIIGYSNNQLFVATILACFMGVLLGFLRFNFPPAKVFMGDAGSLFIGYTLSLLTIINTYYTTETPTSAPIIMPILILAIPIFDTFSVIWIRLKNKVSIFKADKNHLSHRLVKIGMSPKNAVFFIYLVNFSIGLGALLLGALNEIGCFIILLQSVCILIIIVLLEKVKQCYD